MDVPGSSANACTPVFDTGLGQAVDKCVCDAALVAHHDHPGTLAQGDAGGQALSQRGAQHRHGDPPGHPVDGIEIAGDGR